MVGNGLCNEETNNNECNFDGGDCCPNSFLISNGYCNDETNKIECNYDGGDCCVNVDKEHCTECTCFGVGFITSPGFPGEYSRSLDLIWHIEVGIQQIIEIGFIAFDLEETTSCTNYGWDSLTIYDGDTTYASPMLGKYCGDSIPDKQNSTKNSVLIHFETDYWITDETGFKLEYKSHSKLYQFIYNRMP